MGRRNYFELLGLPYDGSLENNRKNARNSAIEAAAEGAIEAWKEKLYAERKSCDSARRSAIEAELALESDLRSALMERKNATPESVIENALKVWRSKLESEKAGGAAASDAKRRAQIDEELALEGEIRIVMFDKKSRRAEAAEMVKLCQDKLGKLLDIQLFGVKDMPEVTEVQVRSVAERLKIPADKAREVYERKGIKVVRPAKAADLKQYFLDDATYGNITNLFGRLKEDKWIQGTAFENTAKAEDLYALACYIEGGSEKDIPAYRRRSTGALKDIMEKHSVQLASDSGSRSYAAILRDLVSIGASKVFDSEEDREKYAHSMQKAQLDEFFALLRQAPADFKKDSDFAENCIKRIQAHFPDYNIALALYNEKAGLNRDPYVRQDARVGVVCDLCGSYTEFSTVAEAERSVCPACGAKLYISCPSCSKLVPASASSCSCGFAIGQLKYLSEYITGAGAAIDRLDLHKADELIRNAQMVSPKDARIAELRKKLAEKRAAYEKPLGELDRLIAAKQYHAADAKLNEIAVKMKELDLSERRKEIKAKLDEAKRSMPSPTLPPVKRGNICYEILEKCADHRPAAEMLAGIPLQTPRNLRAEITGNTCELHWMPAEDRGVSFRVVRKKGGLPISVSDGELLAKGLTVTSYADKGMESGVVCGYAVFAERCGVISHAVTVTAENLGEISRSTLVCGAQTGACTFSWSLPKNAVGVRIIRTEKGEAPMIPGNGCKVLTDREPSGFRDTDVKNGIAYNYRLQCAYPAQNGLRYSKGITVSLRPDAPPVKLTSLSIRHKGTMLDITWKPSECTQNVRVLRFPAGRELPVEDLICQADALDELSGKAEVLASAMVITGKCSAVLHPDSLERLVIITVAGAMVRINRTAVISTAAPCELDPGQTVVKNDRLTIRLKKIPEGLKRIHYCALCRKDEKVPWANVKDIKNGMMRSVSVEDYRSKGSISEEVPEDDIYITVIGEYEFGGEKVYSDPCKLKRNNLPKTRIYYKLINSFITGQHVIRVKADAVETPEMYLVYSESGVPFDHNSQDTITVLTIPREANISPKGTKDHPIPPQEWEKIPVGAKLRLLIGKEDTFDFEMAPQNPANMVR